MAEARVTANPLEVEILSEPADYVTQFGWELEIGPVGLYVTQLTIELEFEEPTIEGPVLCGETMPADMADRGRYTPPTPPILGTSGAGAPNVGRYQSAQYRWDYLTDAEWSYLVDTVLAGVRSTRCQDNTKLWDRDMVLITWSNIVIHRPEAQIVGGQHTNVILRFTHMEA